MNPNNIISSDFIAKITEANSLYREALFGLFPEPAKEHLNVIDRELHALFSDLIIHSAAKDTKKSTDSSQKNSRVKKVDIS